MTTPIRRRGLLLALAAVLAATVSVASPQSALAAGGMVDVFVTDARGTPLGDATVTIGTATASSDYWGRVRFDAATAGEVLVSHPRFGSRRVVWSGTSDRLTVPLGAPVLRAIHVAGTLPGTARWDELVALAETT